MSRRRTELGLEAKLAAVERLAKGESATLLAGELGVSRQRLYDWQAVVPSGADLRVVGRPRREAVVERPRRTDELTAARARAVALERKVAEQALELDFFRQALRQVEALRQAAPGATASTPSSRRRRKGSCPWSWCRSGAVRGAGPATSPAQRAAVGGHRARHR